MPHSRPSVTENVVLPPNLGGASVQQEVRKEPDGARVPPFSAICFLGGTYAPGRAHCRQ